MHGPDTYVRLPFLLPLLLLWCVSFRRVAAEVEGDVLGEEFKGYVFKIMGGQDKQVRYSKTGNTCRDCGVLGDSYGPMIGTGGGGAGQAGASGQQGCKAVSSGEIGLNSWSG
jgi:hypothetical protein